MINKVIGDIHGNMKVLKNHSDYLQLGDFGIGFRGTTVPDRLHGNGKFLRGNHDGPAAARSHPDYFGDYGFKDDIFFVSGAQTPNFDRVHRTEGVNWWRDEQLSYEDLSNAAVLYADIKPDVVVTHDCPFFLYRAMLGFNASLGLGWGDPHPNQTAQLFNQLFEIHRPKFWYFGHWHVKWAANIRGTWFRCVDVEEVVNIGEIM